LSPKVNREEREQVIVQAARKLISNEGFVHFKMSELAREADMSVGTLYSHFPSKEDLLLGIHLHNLSLKQTMFKDIFSKASWSPLQRLIAMTLADWDLDRKMKELSEIDALAMFPSIWKKASPGITGRLEESSRCLGDIIKENIDKVIEDEGIQIQATSTPSNVTLGVSLWSLGLGLHHVFKSFCLQKNEDVSEEAESQIALEALWIMVEGLKPKTKLSLDDLHQLFRDVQSLTEEVVS
jgi:AcrR family transcriptional regulator